MSEEERSPLHQAESGWTLQSHEGPVIGGLVLVACTRGIGERLPGGIQIRWRCTVAARHMVVAIRGHEWSWHGDGRIAVLGRLLG